MTKQIIGKILISIATIQYGFVPPFVDFNATHATNPLWVGHARFHVVWQVFITFFLAIFGLYSVWKKQTEIGLATLLGLFVLGGFFLNVTVMGIYSGTLSDSNGVPPIFGIDANLVSFSIALSLLIIGYFLAKSK